MSRYELLPGGRLQGGWLASFIVFFVVIAAAFVLVIVMLTPQRPLPDTAPAEQFSAGRAQKHIEAVAQEPHPLGSEAIVSVRDYIITELENIGLQPVLQEAPADDYFGISPGAGVIATNVLARIPGENSTGAVLLLAHYDTVPATAGANDCSLCVAVLLETARALQAGPPLENDVILLFSDGEEPAPKYGTIPFVEEHPWMDDISMVLSFEAVGSRGPVEMYETGYDNGWSIRELSRAVSRPVAFSYLDSFFDFATSLSNSYSTDFAVFKDAGIDGLGFAHIYNGMVYHTPGDNVESVSQASLQQHGIYALELVHHFGQIDLAQAQQNTLRDSIYFTAFPGLLVHYPASWALPLLVLVSLLLVGVFVLGFSRRRITVRGVIVGFGSSLLSSVLLLAAVAVAWWAVVGAQAERGIIVSYTGAHVYLGGFLLLAVALNCSLYWLFSRGNHAHSLLSGVLLWWWALSLLTIITLPGLSYLFFWPAFFGAIGLAFMVTRPDENKRAWPDLLLLAVNTFIGGVLLFPIIYDFFNAGLPRPGNLDSEMVQLMGIPVFFVVLLLWLLMPQVMSAASARRAMQ